MTMNHGRRCGKCRRQMWRGWVQAPAGPQGRTTDLCPECAAAWKEAGGV